MRAAPRAINTNFMKKLSGISNVFTAVILTVAATACSANVSTEPTGSTAESLSSSSGGGGTTQEYTCTDSGYCQCSGLDDCDNMFTICKSHTYCNSDPTFGIRCCCLNFVLQTGTTTNQTNTNNTTGSSELAR
jgi:hypothetical protein